MIPETTDLHLIETLCDIAKLQFAHAPAKRRCEQAGWELYGDEPELGYLQYSLRLTEVKDSQRVITIGLGSDRSGPCALLPLEYFDDPDFATADRSPFDRMFADWRNRLTEALGPAKGRATYERDCRPGWPYHFQYWIRGAGQFYLLQDEFDIQFGMDVTLWVFPATTKVFLPLQW